MKAPLVYKRTLFANCKKFGFLIILSLTIAAARADSSAGDSAAAAASATDLQAQIQSLQQTEHAAQMQISQALHLGTASPADVAAAATALRQTQTQRIGLENQLNQLLVQQNSIAAASPPAAPGPLPASALAGLSAPQQAALVARRSLQQQIFALKQQGPVDGQTLANVLTEWQTANAGILNAAHNAEVSASAANRPRLLAHLEAGGAPALLAGNLPPKTKALFAARLAAAKELAIIVLQSTGQSPVAYHAALANWQSKHGAAMGRMEKAADVETKALGIAAAAQFSTSAPPPPAP